MGTSKIVGCNLSSEELKNIHSIIYYIYEKLDYINTILYKSTNNKSNKLKRNDKDIPTLLPQELKQSIMTQMPNQMTQDPNQMTQDPNQMTQMPNQMTQMPNQMTQMPNQIIQDPNQMTQDPNQMTQDPNQMTNNNIILENPVNIYTPPSYHVPNKYQGGLKNINYNKTIENINGKNMNVYKFRGDRKKYVKKNNNYMTVKQYEKIYKNKKI